MNYANKTGGAVQKKKSFAGNKAALIFFLLTVPTLLLYIVFFVFPLGMGTYYSMTDWDGFSLNYRFIGLKNYIDILQDKRFLQSVNFTFLYAFIVVVIKLFIALMLAIFLSGKLKFRGFFRSVYFFPAVLSMITVGLIFNQIYYSVFPSIGQTLGIDWLSRNILGNKSTAIFGIALTNIWHGIATPMVIFIAGLASVPKDLKEASLIDGATPMQRFFSVSLPFLIPMLTVNLVMSIKSSLTVFDYIVAMTDGGFGTESMGFLIYKHGMAEMKFGYGTAEAIYVFVMIAVISFIQIKFLNRKEAGQL
ncbi:carbohydrate ABC transporter permease [Paenibacillus endoradicis]|uniref:carbohydrate ABC transporter permease n=1 Tax=Paenibacillus endoradicis TaxID=2972487 RepID=UPI002158E9D8|nr:sugar ABC transporter permease [Paenibacillus endoradicis]MCR8658569.1 sugar ABC transporter permease [Paenibacillus endoradicis]